MKCYAILGITFWILGPTSCFAQESKALRETLATATRLAFTESLPDADRIEIFTLAMDLDSDESSPDAPKGQSQDRFLIRNFDGSIPKKDEGYVDVEQKATLEGSRCNGVLAGWRRLKFRPNGALCHTPRYGVRMYRDNKLLFETTICWKCSNFFVPEYDPESGEVKSVIYGFENNASAKKLLKLFQQVLPLRKQSAPSG